MAPFEHTMAPRGDLQNERHIKSKRKSCDFWSGLFAGGTRKCCGRTICLNRVDWWPRKFISFSSCHSDDLVGFRWASVKHIRTHRSWLRSARTFACVHKYLRKKKIQSTGMWWQTSVVWSASEWESSICSIDCCTPKRCNLHCESCWNWKSNAFDRWNRPHRWKSLTFDSGIFFMRSSTWWRKLKKFKDARVLLIICKIIVCNQLLFNL